MGTQRMVWSVMLSAVLAMGAPIMAQTHFETGGVARLIGGGVGLDAGAAPYRDGARKFTFSPPAGWQLVHADANMFAYQAAGTTIVIYFGPFRDLFFTVGGAGSPWNVKMGSGHDNFTATAGSYVMKAVGNGQMFGLEPSDRTYARIIAGPAMEVYQLGGAYDAIDSYFKWDTPEKPKGSTSCAGCAQMLMNHMNAMTQGSAPFSER